MLTNEQKLTVREITQLQRLRTASGPPSVKKVSGWMRNGVSGHRLENIKIGWMRYSSEAAVERFLAAIAADDAGHACQQAAVPEESAVAE